MPTPEVPIISEHPESVIVSESLQQSGVQPAPSNVVAVNDNKGNPMISTPATQSAKIQIPADKSSLLKKAKGSITNAASWLAKFLLRAIALKENANNIS